jgi:hypothetical protein
MGVTTKPRRAPQPHGALGVWGNGYALGFLTMALFAAMPR